MNFALQPPTRRCVVSGQMMKAGDRFFAALFTDGPKLARQDFAVEHWTGPPSDAVAYWVGHVPLDNGPPRASFDDEMLVQCYRQLDETHEPAQINFRYVLALLLLRRKRLRLENEITDAVCSTMVLADMKSGERSHVRNPRLSEQDLKAAQDEVFRLMGWD